MKNRQKLSVTLVALLVTVVGLSIAYAALSQTLNITVNKVTENVITFGATWGSTCTLTTGGTSNTGRSCGAASGSGANLTIGDTTLSKPGDSCTYQCTINNTNDITVAFASVTPTAPTASSGSCSVSGTTITCKNSSNTSVLTYKIGKNNTCSTALSTSDTIDKNGSLTVYVCVAYAASSTQGSALTFSNAKYAIVFNQQ